MLQAALQGKPLQQPLHPILVRLPVGLFLLSLLLDLSTWFLGPSNLMVRGAFWALTFGVLAALAARPDRADEPADRTDHLAPRLGNHYRLIHLVAVAMYVVNGLLRLGALDAVQTPSLPLACSLAGMGLLTGSGCIADVMVDDQDEGRRRRADELSRRP